MTLLWLPLAVAFSAMLCLPSAAHEFWIEPERYELAPGETLRAALRTGQRFEGPSAPYLPSDFRRFELAAGGEPPRPVESRLGDRPALRAEMSGPGLVTILHVTRDYVLEWETWRDFESFLRHKDAAWVLRADAEAGRAPRADVVESYSRHAKSLVAVGDGAGADRARGLLTEIVALENPYTGDLSDGLDIRVLYEGAPRADAQVEIFAKSGDGRVRVATARTDGAGRATIPVAPGVAYLLDAVVFRAPSAALADATGAEWESLWASLTFRTPG